MVFVICLEKEEIERLYHGIAIDIQRRLAANLQRPKKRIIVIAGPTCVGKSSFAMALAPLLGAEIISADSMQIYRGMDIGTAKPSREDRDTVPHHLIDIHDITESFSSVDFYYEARQACQLIHARDNTVLVVGGSGFYLHSLIYGPPSGPPSIPELRKSLENEIETLGADILFERLEQLDSEYAATITKNDKQKIVRALEIITLTGKKVSKLAWKNRLKPLNYEFHCWFLHRPRPSLYQRIDRRCEQMLNIGFLDEVRALKEAGLESNASASQAIGYRQALEFLNKNGTAQEYAEFVDQFKKASRHYAKRQMTWFRHDHEPLFRWIDLDMHDPEVAMDIITKDFKAR